MKDWDKPSLASIARAFAPIHAVFKKMRSGEVEAIGGYPVMLDWEGVWTRVDHVLTGWCNVFLRVTDKCPQGHLRQMIRYLANGIPLTLELIDACELELKAQQIYLVSASLSEVKSVINTELLSIEIESLGLNK
jgi:hypothetical protein